MLHPETKLTWISDDIGYGIFAKHKIPKGSVIYVKDQLEVMIHASHHLLAHPAYQPIIDRFAYIDSLGNYIISWDFAKYINHSCSSNVLSTGYGFEIAIRDIEPGEEITDDYRMFVDKHHLECKCGSPECTGLLRYEDYDNLVGGWDAKVRAAIDLFHDVPQPLAPFVEDEKRLLLDLYLRTGDDYRPVYFEKPFYDFPIASVNKKVGIRSYPYESSPSVG